MGETKISANEVVAEIVDDYMSKCEFGAYIKETFLDHWVTKLGDMLKAESIDVVIFALAYSSMSDLICDF